MHVAIIRYNKSHSWWLPVYQLLLCFAIRCGAQHQAGRTSNNLTTINRTPGRAANSSHPMIDSSLADWLLIESDPDLLSEEAKHSKVLFAEAGASYKGPKQRSPPKRKSGQSAAASNFSKSAVDEEAHRSDSSDPNEIYDEIEDPSSAAAAPKEPECAAHNRYYCTYKEDYPLKLVTEVTKYYKWPLEKLFRDLHAQIMPKLADDSTGNLVCDSFTRVVRPGWARNTNDKWLVVINTENYHQYVTEVVCQYGSNSRCNFIPPCYYSSCQQRYNTQKLLVIDPNNPYRGPFLSEFLFPSCCVCYVPSASDSYQDKYRSAPTSIYQRTIQQEAASNLYPPKFRPTGLMEEVGSLSGSEKAAASSISGTELDLALLSKQQQVQQPLAPGEVRRVGEQYRKGSGKDVHELSADFPRLGMSDTLVDFVDSDKKSQQT